jgi:hypothetical protein
MKYLAYLLPTLFCCVFADYAAVVIFVQMGTTPSTAP